MYVSIIYTIRNRLENYIDPIFLKSKESMSINKSTYCLSGLVPSAMFVKKPSSPCISCL